MTRSPEEILAQVNAVFARVLGNPSIVVGAATTARDVPEWDSLNHASLIAAVEDEFAIKLTLKEIMRLQNVGDLCAAIAAKLR